MWRTARWWLLVSLVTLCACGGQPIAVQQQTAQHHIALTLDSRGMGQRQATIQIRTVAGEPVTQGQITLESAMPDMDMRMPSLIAEQSTPGTYVTRGELFSMLGIWELTVRVGGVSGQDSAQFQIEATP